MLIVMTKLLSQMTKTKTTFVIDNILNIMQLQDL